MASVARGRQIGPEEGQAATCPSSKESNLCKPTIRTGIHAAPAQGCRIGASEWLRGQSRPIFQQPLSPRTERLHNPNSLAASPSLSAQKVSFVNPDKIAAHLRVNRYDSFVLTDAVRPGLQLPVVPREGFRLDVYRDSTSRLHVPVLAASVSRERLFDVFLDLLSPLGETVDVVLETSHHSQGNQHRDLLREDIDL